ncbi:hypothetical protein BDP55DRAFT_772269 [Colletotrichum godetiae]|uniref:Uncharacterized protein n=1 Tax=Colletotrichum godetiae TaxID=1209918 RepID=A0AAJ0EST0_9PEZI|nr:uncharacterized protein BDP55DRAFT_772269 [Colletotrichum godetiae]KAK1659854.1 hypothetical protein BDP55DRAFT_772269 [Colletotrichum godetiae]
MGNKQSTPQRRNTDNTEKHLQYHTVHGPVSAHDVAKHLETVPPPHTRTPSNFPHDFRGREGPVNNETKTFDDYVTGPGRSQGPTGPMQEYAIPQPGEQFNFQFDRRCLNARQAGRVVHPNERANVMGPANGRPGNDPMQTRAAVRVAQVNGDEKIAVVGVVAHPNGNRTGLVRAPLEPLSREGRQELTRHTDERGRMQTYPPRGIDAKVYETAETRSGRVRPPAHPQMRV